MLRHLNKKILIVDNDPDMRLGLHVRLEANHFDTCFAADAMTAISEARRHRPDLVILDLGLPAGDGFVVMERLKANDYLASIPVLVVSARHPYPNRERALKDGAKAFFQKLVNNEELLSSIRHFLGEPDASM